MCRDERMKDREHILKCVETFYTKYHVNGNHKTGERIPYASRVYDSEEICNLVDSALEFWLTSGRWTAIFESEFANFLGAKHCALVNSGSSANLLAFMTLTSPLLGERSIKRGDEIITVAAGFPTTIAPIFQFGAIPVFVDITIPQYNIDVTKLEQAMSNKTKAIMLAHTLGNPFDIKTIKSFCDRNGLWLIEDNCDALGSRYCLDGKWSYTGIFGDIGTSSFYPPHHMTMGEGGAVYTNDDLLAKIIKSMRDWGRDCVCNSGMDNVCGYRFGRQYGELPLGYDHKYVYSHFGYNLKATDMQAAIGCAQLKKLDGFIARRKKNFKFLKDRLKGVQSNLILPEACDNADPSWFGFLVTCKDGIARNQLVSILENANIQTRMLFAGNIIKHPCFSNMVCDKDYRTIGQLEKTDHIMNNSFWVGLYPGMTENMLEEMATAIRREIDGTN